MKTKAVLAILAFALLFGCLAGNPGGESTNSTASPSISAPAGEYMSAIIPSATPEKPPADDSLKVEVIHFHGTNQCASCIKVGELAEKTVNIYFSNELKSGRLAFSHINAELPENQAIASKYGVTGASLWIGVYSGEKFSKEQNTNVWYKIGNEADYLAYLKGILEKKLSGETG